MRIIRCKDYADMSREAANLIAAEITVKPDAVLGLATGTTPIGIYDNLCEKHEDGNLSFAEVKTVNLDEYVGLAPGHNQSYRYFMDKHLFSRLNIDPANTNLPNGLAGDIAAEGKRYDELIRAYGGIDLHLLGLGHNGHIGFNEPEECFISETHEVRLTRSTIEANSRLFDDISEVPVKAVTMGMKSIMASKIILLVVNGSDKAEIVRETLFGPITPQVPGSILQLHPNLVVIMDAEAASLI